MKPNITVKSDYDGYFERLVRGWIARKEEFKHAEIVITAGPYRPDAVTFESNGNVIHLDFYSALRTGFGSLSEADVAEIVELL